MKSFLISKSFLKLDQKMKADASSARAPTRRFKNFGILDRRFRHRPFLHSKIFSAIANITQLTIETGASPLFEIEYYDGYDDN